MIDLTNTLRCAVSAVVPCTQAYPARAAAFPSAAVYESGNAVQARCNGGDYLSALEYTVEIRAYAPGDTHALSVRVDEAVGALGFSRVSCTDLYDSALRVHRRVMRYRVLCDADGTLYQ